MMQFLITEFFNNFTRFFIYSAGHIIRMEMTQIKHFMDNPDISAVGQKLAAHIQQALSYKDSVDLGSQLPWAQIKQPKVIL